VELDFKAVAKDIVGRADVVFPVDNEPYGYKVKRCQSVKVFKVGRMDDRVFDVFVGDSVKPSPRHGIPSKERPDGSEIPGDKGVLEFDAKLVLYGVYCVRDVLMKGFSGL